MAPDVSKVVVGFVPTLMVRQGGAGAAGFGAGAGGADGSEDEGGDAREKKAGEVALWRKDVFG